MSIFRKGTVLGSEEPRYKIRITTDDGEVLEWHKRGELHLVEEDVARIFIEKFKPQLFEVRPDGSFTPPAPGETKRVAKLEMVRVP